MNQAIFDRLWEESEPNFFGTKEEFLKQWEGYRLEVHNVEGEVAFVALVKEPLFHFHSFKHGRALSKQTIKQFLRDIIARSGYAETRTPIMDGRQQRFNHRLGFVEASRDEHEITYRIERVQ